MSLYKTCLSFHLNAMKKKTNVTMLLSEVNVIKEGDH